MLNIRASDTVLEIGSGNRPRSRANVLCDKFPADNTERAGGQPLALDRRPFVVADACALPFRSKSFDYVITSHLLEHIPDPGAFVAELTRVASAGYIETPSELGEAIFGWSFHRWRVHLDNGTLVLRPRRSPSVFGEYFHSAYENSTLFAEFVDTHRDDFYVRLEWRGTIPIRVDNRPGDEVQLNRGTAWAPAGSSLRGAIASGLLMIATLLLRVGRHLRKEDG